jgi:hypothetical protein
MEFRDFEFRDFEFRDLGEVVFTGNSGVCDLALLCRLDRDHNLRL